VTHPDLDLLAHGRATYDKGRGRVWQALWFAVSMSLFTRWWFPASFRPRLLRFFGAKVGNDVYIRHSVRIHWPWKLSIGDQSWLGEGAWFLNLAPIVLGSNVCISQEALLLTGSHDRRSSSFRHKNAELQVGDGAWVCARAILLPGAEVGCHAVISAASVVQGRVPPNVVYTRHTQC
jgi:putative colanic acid biosynthesis acetyltransferase WcaF